MTTTLTHTWYMTVRHVKGHHPPAVVRGAHH